MDTNEPTIGSLDTNIRLLAQRVAAVESHLNRLGDTVRINSSEIPRLQATITKDGDFIHYRLNEINKSLDAFSLRQKETSNRYWQLVIGVTIGIITATLLVYLGLR